MAIRFGMNLSSNFLVAALLGAALVPGGFVTNPSFAQDAAGKSTVAKVGDITITEKDLGLVMTEMQGRMKNVPAGERRKAALDSLIDIRLLAKLAEKDETINKTLIEERLAFERARMLHNEYFSKNIATNISEADLKARYEKEIAATKPTEEIRARHILLKTEEEAMAVIELLNKGGDFEALAKEKSTGPSGPRGGDLGFFGKGQMVPEFETAAFALEVGGVTAKPVKTQFGFHVIKTEEKRMSEPPKFETIQGQLRQTLLRERYVEAVRAARAAVTIEIMEDKLNAADKKN